MQVDGAPVGGEQPQPWSQRDSAQRVVFHLQEVLRAPPPMMNVLVRVWKASRRQQDWILKCLQGGRAHPLVHTWGGHALLLSTGAAGNPNPSVRAAPWGGMCTAPCTLRCTWSAPRTQKRPSLSLHACTVSV
jgi:hypothetical protein